MKRLNARRPLPPNLVEVYDFDNENVRTIPTAELAPGMVPLSLAHLGRVCWVNVTQAQLRGHLLCLPEGVDYMSSIGESESIPVKQLGHEETREILRSASLVIGIDVHTGSQMLFYGDDVLQEVCRTNVAAPLPIASFRYDSRTDSLEYFGAAVTVLKGSCCYR